MAIEMRLGELTEPARAQLSHMGIEVRPTTPRVWPVRRADWAALCRAQARAGKPGSPEFTALLPLRVAPLPDTLVVPGDAPLTMKANDKHWAAGPAPALRMVGAARVAAAARDAAAQWSDAEPGVQRAIEAIAAAAATVEETGTPTLGAEATDLLAGPVEGDAIDALLAELAAYLDMSTGNGLNQPIPGLDAVDWQQLAPADRRRLHDGLLALPGSDGTKRRQIVATLVDPIAATLDRPDPVDLSRLDAALPYYATLPWFTGLRAGELRDAIATFIEREVPKGAADPLAFAALRVVSQWPGAAPFFVTFDYKETPRPPAGSTRLTTPGDDYLYTTLTGGALDALLAEGLIRPA